MDPRHTSIDDFSYDLPKERIAFYPLEERDASKLLVYDGVEIRQDQYRHLAEYLPPAAHLVFNNSRVIEARIRFTKPTGGQIELFCLEPDGRYPDIATAMIQQQEVYWNCLIGGAGKWKHGTALSKSWKENGRALTLTATLVERLPGSFTIRFQWDHPGTSFAEILHAAGDMPLPPYIKRETEALDLERYQTVYARHDGSVAAPTAGLHFTSRVFGSLEAKGITHDFITLHVGAGTFKPVQSRTMEGHHMHAEHFVIERSFLQSLLKHQGSIFCVGTTSMRALESIYWMGVKAVQNPISTAAELEVSQWDAYESAEPLPAPQQALHALLEWMDRNELESMYTQTSILIAPGYQVRLTEGLITNFHQPQSTLLLLVAALIGDDWKRVYRYALDNEFRFLSYGDGSLLYARR